MAGTRYISKSSVAYPGQNGKHEILFEGNHLTLLIIIFDKLLF